MRKEMVLFNNKHSPGRWKTLYTQFKETISIKLLQFRLHHIELGSKEWHIMQEKLSHGSSVGIDMAKRNYFYRKTLRNCGDKPYIFPGVIMYYPGNIKIGYNVFINRGVYFTAQAKIMIGDNVLIGPYTVFNSGSHLYQDPSRIIRDQGHKLGPITIENDVWIGAHVIVLPGVTIGKGAVVAAGAVVAKSVEPYTVIAGIPARIISRRGAGNDAES